MASENQIKKIFSLAYIANNIDREFYGYLDLGDFVSLLDKKWSRKPNRNEIFNIELDDFGYPNIENIKKMANSLIKAGLIISKLENKEDEPESFVRILKGNGSKKIVRRVLLSEGFYSEDDLELMDELESNLADLDREEIAEKICS